VYIGCNTDGNLDGTNLGSRDIFVIKYDSSGTEIWRKQIGTSGYDSEVKIAFDSYNNLYITGCTNGNLDGTNQGSLDIFVMKFDSSGTEVWRKQIGNSGEENLPYDIATDSNNNLYITGYTDGNLAGTNQGSLDIFVIIFDSNGTEIGRKQIGTTELDMSHAITIDSNNDVYITGQTKGVLDGTNQGSDDIFIAKYSHI
jgi:hypothetical protein